jgi:hypothetical protein
MAQLALVELPEWLHDMRVIPHYGFRDELQDTGMHLVFLEILLELVVCALEDDFFLDEGSGTVEALLRSLVADQVLMLCHHEKQGVLKLPHVEGYVIEEFHHTVDELERHEGYGLLVLKELFENELVTADHVNGKTWVH